MFHDEERTIPPFTISFFSYLSSTDTSNYHTSNYLLDVCLTALPPLL